MKTNYFWILIALMASLTSIEAQEKWFTKTGSISFFSKAPLENIEAHNKKVTCVLDTESGQLEFSMLMKAFQFEKALMQEHFNENYVESDKHPKSTFSGKITNIDKVSFKKDGNYAVQVTGDLTIKGITKNVSAPGTIIVKGGKVNASSEFQIALSDFNVSIPAVNKDNISNNIKINVDLSFEPLKK
jgi:hypothetical protein